MAKVVVTGGRDYPDHAMVWNILSSMKIDQLYVGDANGADRFALEWAQFFEIPVKVFRADWNGLGRAAGPIRNDQMLEEAGKGAIVVAFLGGAGTRNCTDNALKRGMIVMRVEE